MAINEELTEFIRNSLIQGIPRADIKHALLQSGWEMTQINGALDAFSEVKFPIPVPKPKPYVSARDAFLYLILFSTLYSSVFHFGSFVFDLINFVVPDPSLHPSVYHSYSSSIKWSISSILIAFPIFLIVRKKLGDEAKVNPNKRISKIRKWLTYMTLFLASGALICDLTFLVFNFISGGSTLRFLLKALTVGFIAGIVFIYYLADMRKVDVALSD